MRPRVWTSLILSAVVLAMGAGALAQQQRSSTARSPAKPSFLDKLTVMMGQPAKPAAAPAANPGAPQPLAVDWTASKRYAQAGASGRGGRATAGFVGKNRGAIDSLSVPVLLPGDPDLVASLRLFPHGDFYTISSTANGMSFVMTGHSKAYPLPPGAARGLGKGGLAGRIPADGIVIEGNESGLNADFTRFGAVYSIALDCRDKLADPRCGSEAYVRGVIARMTVVLPAGRS